MDILPRHGFLFYATFIKFIRKKKYIYPLFIGRVGKKKLNLYKSSYFWHGCRKEKEGTKGQETDGPLVDMFYSLFVSFCLYTGEDIEIFIRYVYGVVVCRGGQRDGLWV